MNKDKDIARIKTKFGEMTVCTFLTIQHQSMLKVSYYIQKVDTLMELYSRVILVS